MRDPRVVEIEFLADRERDPQVVSAEEYAAKLGVSQKFVVDMVFSLFRDGCLEGAAQIRVPNHTYEPIDVLGRHPREKAVESLLSPSASCPAYVNHDGRVRLWNLRDQIAKARTREKFGILWDRRDWATDVAVRLAMLDSNAPSAVIFWDLDGFKTVNDKLLHDVGDAVLRMVFDTVATLTKGVGEAYGWGGDEVVVFLPGVDADTAQKLARAIDEKVAQQCATHSALTAAGLPVTISVGCYSFTGRESADDIARKADALMYEAKAKRKAARSAQTIC